MPDNVGIVVTYPSLAGDLTVPSLAGDPREVILTVSMAGYEPPVNTPLFLYTEDYLRVIDAVDTGIPGLYFDSGYTEDKFSLSFEKCIEDGLDVSDVFGVIGSPARLDAISFAEALAFNIAKNISETTHITEVFGREIGSMNTAAFDNPSIGETLSKYFEKPLTDAITKIESLTAFITDYMSQDYVEIGYVGSFLTLPVVNYFEKTLADTITKTELLTAGITNYTAQDFTQGGYVGTIEVISNGVYVDVGHVDTITKTELLTVGITDYMSQDYAEIGYVGTIEIISNDMPGVSFDVDTITKTETLTVGITDYMSQDYVQIGYVGSLFTL